MIESENFYDEEEEDAEQEEHIPQTARQVFDEPLQLQDLSVSPKLKNSSTQKRLGHLLTSQSMKAI